MEQIIVRKPNGDMLPLMSTYPVCFVSKATQSKGLLGDDTLSVSVESVVPINFGIGDEVEVFGEVYTLNRLPGVKKEGDRRFLYELQLEGPQYSLLRLLFMNVDVNGFSTGTEFSLTGNLATFAGVLLNNIGRGLTGWSLGSVAETGVKTLTFSKENCLRVLQRLAEEFGVEFSIGLTSDKKRILSLDKIGSVLPLTFEYGRAGGLYTLSRENVTDKDFITRLYAYGSTKNLPTGYRNFSTRLSLATPGYLEKASARQAFGVIEGTQEFEDIYPHRTGTVATVGSDSLSFTDVGMDFDLKASNGTVNGKPDYKYLLGGQTAKVSFLTGSLAGYELEVSDYVHSTKTFTVKPFTDERDQTFPSVGTFAIKPGDTYVLLDLIMPETYVTAAEAALLTAAQVYLDQNAAPRVQYKLDIDPQFLAARGSGPSGAAGVITNHFSLGDYVHIKDNDFGIDATSRVIGFSRDVMSPNTYTLDIADTYQVTLIERILAEQAETKTIIRINDLRDGTRARYGWRNTQELLSMVFDADGYFNGERIKPETVETALLAVGGKSGEFVLNVVMEPNYNGLANTIRTGAGSLVHIGIEEAIRTWQFTAQTVDITSDTARYIYAKCHRSNYNDAVILFSTEQLKATDDATYYYFLIGILHAKDSELNVRWISLTYGSTTISGRFIRTGRIQSADGSTYFDLDGNEIGGKISFVGADGQPRTLASLATDVADFAAVIGEVSNQVDGKIETFYYAGVPTFVNLPASAWTTPEERAKHVGDLYYDTNTNIAYRYTVSNITYSWVENRDRGVTEALQLASLALDTADHKRRVFLVQPYAPYDVGDLWTDGQHLRKCVTARAEGQTYNPLDWELATFYDNTKTTIDGGIITSGRIQLAGDLGSILAGISGEGTLPTSVRFWSGASHENRAFAPFRVLQSGEVFARKRIELLNENNVGQAGIAGSNTSADGPVRIWAGSDYDGRNTAPFNVEADGSMTATKGRVGGLTIQGNSLTNEGFQNDGAIIMRNDQEGSFAAMGANVLPASSGNRAMARFENTHNDPLFATNYGVMARATGGLTNVAIYAAEGSSHLGQLVIMGQKTYVDTLVSINLQMDPTLYGAVNIHSTNSVLTFAGPMRFPLLEGKEMAILNTNNQGTLRLSMIRGNPNYLLNGGCGVKIIYSDGFWYPLSTPGDINY